jgi:hypothetical protein
MRGRNCGRLRQLDLVGAHGLTWRQDTIGRSETIRRQSLSPTDKGSSGRERLKKRRAWGNHSGGIEFELR